MPALASPDIDVSSRSEGAGMDAAYLGATRGWRLPDHLPDLKGKWLTAYTVVWAIMLALAIVGPIRSQYFLGVQFETPAWQPFGFAPENPSGAVRVLAVFSDEAVRAGVR